MDEDTSTVLHPWRVFRREVECRIHFVIILAGWCPPLSYLTIAPEPFGGTADAAF